MESCAYGHDTQDAGETEDTEEREDTEVTGVVSGGFDSDLAADIADVFGAVNVTLIDDEPPDDMLLTPRDPTADLSPAAQAADFTRRVQTVADTVRPKPSVSVSNDEPPIDDAYADAKGEQVNGDTRVAAPAKVSRRQAAGHNKAP
jgi:hypothetical protein